MKSGEGLTTNGLKAVRIAGFDKSDFVATPKESGLMVSRHMARAQERTERTFGTILEVIAHPGHYREVTRVARVSFYG